MVDIGDGLDAVRDLRERFADQLDRRWPLKHSYSLQERLLLIEEVLSPLRELPARYVKVMVRDSEARQERDETQRALDETTEELNELRCRVANALEIAAKGLPALMVAALTTPSEPTEGGKL